MSPPNRIRQWWPFLQATCRQQALNIFTLAAILDRESNGGEALRPPGPEGTGDFIARKGAHYANNPRFRHVATDKEGVALYMPADLQGWGRGLMQLDWEAHPEYLALHLPSGLPAWTDARICIQLGGQILSHAVSTFKRVPGGADAELCAVAAYNAGEGAVARVLKTIKLPPTMSALVTALDAITEGRNYVSDVCKRRDVFARPELPPQS